MVYTRLTKSRRLQNNRSLYICHNMYIKPQSHYSWNYIGHATDLRWPQHSHEVYYNFGRRPNFNIYMINFGLAITTKHKTWCTAFLWFLATDYRRSLSTCCKLSYLLMWPRLNSIHVEHLICEWPWTPAIGMNYCHISILMDDLYIVLVKLLILFLCHWQLA